MLTVERNGSPNTGDHSVIKRKKRLLFFEQHQKLEGGVEIDICYNFITGFVHFLFDHFLTDSHTVQTNKTIISFFLFLFVCLFVSFFLSFFLSLSYLGGGPLGR
jgi:hypothetical protein